MDVTIVRAGKLSDAAQYAENLGCTVIAARSYLGFATLDVELDDAAMAAITLAEADGELAIASAPLAL